MINTNILIIGAGPAGTSAALFLAQHGVSSTIVDKAVFPRDKICGDALSGKVVEVLNKLNVDYVEELTSHKQFLGSWGVTFVAPNGQSLRIPFKSSKTEIKKAPGFIAKRIDFDNWLFEKAKANPLIETLEGCEIRKFERITDGITAYSTNGTQITAKLIIACDGAYSTFAKDIAGLQTEPAHNCFGLRAYYKNVSGLDAQNFIELHFIKDILPGYFWIFPLPDGYANVGIGMRADKMSAQKINLKKSFERLVSEHPSIRQRFENARLQGDVKLFGLPLGSKKRKISGNNYLLCGDAAQLIDPFTGEGIGNAMMSGMYAAHQAVLCLAQSNFSENFNQQYNTALYNRLWSELLLSYRMQQLVNYPSLFNFVVHKANANALLRETISCMFEDLDMRARLKNPLFYLKLLFS
ncbi:MAG: geranylgeranyl reductase family protein [Chitinophagales bacterium]|nr:geranylgeranyl reductase family protein [Chitinophagales bacterium]